MMIKTISDLTFHLNKIFDECDSFVEYQDKNSQLLDQLAENFCQVIQITGLHNINNSLKVKNTEV